MEAEPTAAQVDEPPAKKKKGDKGLPLGIVDRPDKGGKYQARIYADRYGRGSKKQEFIPGLFATVEEAEAAKTGAEQKLATLGVTAIWPNDAERTGERNKRGQVRLRAPMMSTV